MKEPRLFSLAKKRTNIYVVRDSNVEMIVKKRCTE